MKERRCNPNKILGRLEAGTLVRKDWGDGRERACLLAALVPECAENRSAGACPAEVMPAWLARMTPLMDDEGSEDAWEPFVRRYAAVAARWHVLNEAGWHRAFLGSLIAILEIAREHDPLGSCDAVIALCREGAPAEDPRWNAAAGRALAPMWGADATAEAAAVRAAMWGAAKAAAAAAAAWRAAVWNRMTAGILSAIEAECEKSLSLT